MSQVAEAFTCSHKASKWIRTKPKSWVERFTASMTVRPLTNTPVAQSISKMSMYNSPYSRRLMGDSGARLAEASDDQKPPILTSGDEITNSPHPYVTAVSHGSRFTVPYAEDSVDSINTLMRLRSQMGRVVESAKANGVLPRVVAAFRTLELYEGDRPPSHNVTSYTVDKRQMVLCLRDKTGALHDFNDLVYVALHELAHVGARSYNHGTEFNRIFSLILRLAVENGVWTPTDYSRRPFCYCNSVNVNRNVAGKFWETPLREESTQDMIKEFKSTQLG